MSILEWFTTSFPVLLGSLGVLKRRTTLSFEDEPETTEESMVGYRTLEIRLPEMEVRWGRREIFKFKYIESPVHERTKVFINI